MKIKPTKKHWEQTKKAAEEQLISEMLGVKINRIIIRLAEKEIRKCSSSE